MTGDTPPIVRVQPRDGFPAPSDRAERQIAGMSIRQHDTITAVPTNYVIDRGGVPRYANTGAFDRDGLNATLVPLLREAVPPPGPGAS